MLCLSFLQQNMQNLSIKILHFLGFLRQNVEFLPLQFYFAPSSLSLSLSEELPNQAASFAPQKVQTRSGWEENEVVQK